MSIRTALAVFALATLPVAVANAADCSASPCTDDMLVSAEVVGSCTSLTVNDLDFMADRAIVRTQNLTANVVANCSTGQAYTIFAGYGLNKNGATQRRVKADGGTFFMDYSLFQPAANGSAAQVTPWGDATGGQTGYANTGTGANQTFVATGVLTRNTTTPIDTYTDVVTFTMTY